MYHSIAEEIPPEFQSLVRKFYVTVLYAWIALLWNFICNFAIWLSDASSTGASDCMWSALFVVLGVPIAWRTWYRGVYNGVRYALLSLLPCVLMKHVWDVAWCSDRKTGNWLYFFLFFAAHIVFGVLMGVGVPSVAAAYAISFSSCYIGYCVDIARVFPCKGVCW